MNDRDTEYLIISYLKNFYYHDGLLSDVKSIISCSGYEKKFLHLLYVRLVTLAQLGERVLELKEFEELRYADGLCSMHFSGKDFNIRILFYFREDTFPVLLSSFSEKAGKRKTDYSSHIPTAMKRKTEMEEKFKNE